MAVYSSYRINRNIQKSTASAVSHINLF